MSRKILKHSYFCTVIILFIAQISIAQSYKKDSIQIKAYTEITYNNNKVESIKLKKVFCDYCSEFQLESIGEEALYRANAEKYLPENKLKKGKKRLAIYIRISKVDFAAIKNPELIEDQKLIKNKKTGQLNHSHTDDK
ncbi:hypothetical protein [uncultured Lacinutrix sp.]|uniref:hypothetical protein n=1 Tax=uncultured Lacinutrix sp. TaxID=574032 RepID=UPI00263355B3|nr:hypothetical protein [uncultured Lacinutrix sp.]